MDALCANDLVDDPPHLEWKMAPFDGHWPASLFASQDGVAWTRCPWTSCRLDGRNFARRTWLTSLGVHEHRNSGTDRKYSRNLGKAAGIELYSGPPIVLK